jgi:hypothetical protein
VGDDRLTVSARIAKAIPTEPPEGEKIAVFTPITLPSTSKVGPPTLVDGRIDLDEVVRASADIASAGGDDAGGHRAAEPNDYDRHPIADPG